MNKDGEKWIEDPKHMYGSFGDQDECTQDTNDEIVLSQAISTSAKPEDSSRWVTGAYNELHTIGAL